MAKTKEYSNRAKPSPSRVPGWRQAICCASDGDRNLMNMILQTSKTAQDLFLLVCFVLFLDFFKSFFFTTKLLDDTLERVVPVNPPVTKS